MTTDRPTTRSGPAAWGPRAAGRASVLSGLGCAVIGLLAAGLGLAVSGWAAAWGALVGAGLAGGVFVLGALAVQVATWLYPPAALLVAMLTYVSQVLAAMTVFSLLDGGALGDDLDVSTPWVGGTLATCALLWVTVHVRVAATARVPLYDLPEAGAR
jgi:ATP synthase protein I